MSSRRAEVVLLLALAAPALAAERTVALERSGDAVVGQPAPWFAGWTPGNEILNRTKLLQRPGKAHALVFFATTCAPCERGLRALAARRGDLVAQGLDLVLVAIGEPAEVVGPWLAARDLADATVLLDPFGRAARALGGAEVEGGREVLRLPRTVVIGADGKVRAIFGEEGADYADRMLAEARRTE